MTTGWLAKAGGFTVEHVPCPHPNVPVDMASAPKGVQHTTEGWTVESALSVFLKSDAPTFLVGLDLKARVRVLQLIPLGFIAAALEHTGWPPTNGWARAQIELVGFSQHKPWKPGQPVLAALAALYGALAQTQRIPLHHVMNPLRDPQVWAHGSGWFGHDGVPQNVHWDPGVFDYDAVFARASRGLLVAPLKPRPKPLVLHPRTYTLVRRANGLVYAEPLDRPH